MMRRILITGCNGLLGQKLTQRFLKTGHELSGIDLADSGLRSDFNYYQQDLALPLQTVSLIKELAPEVIIHTAALTDVDACERDKDKCWKVNVNATENICKAAQRIGASLVFISSDYIFDGQNGPYSELARPSPINYYGRSKLAAENLIRGSQIPNTIIRTIVLYGLGIQAKSSFISWLLGKLRQREEVQIVTDQWSNSTLADDLAESLERIIDLQYAGIINIAGRDFMTRYEFALQAAQVFGLDQSLIHPVTSDYFPQAAQRPMKSGLLIDLAEELLGLKLHTVRESLEIYRQQEQLNVD